MNGNIMAPPLSVPATARSRPELRPYQIDVMERVRQRIREGHQRIILQASCGAGKTSVSSEIVRLAVEKRKRCLFIAHRRRLVEQKSARLSDFGVDHGVLMAGHDQNRHSLVQVACRDTLLERCVRTRRAELPPADLVIVDEGHRVKPGGGGYRDLLDAYPDAVTVMLTATPVWPDGSGMGRYFTALECAVPPSQLIRDGYLVPVRCYAPERKAGKNGKVQGGKGLKGDPVAAWRMWAEGRPTVLFSATCEASRAVVNRFNAAGIPAEHIDAQTPDEEREAVFERMARGRTLAVGNVGILIEGADLPFLSCCQMLRSAGSCIFFVQCAGRVMRPYPGKREAVLIDHFGSIFKHGFPDEDMEWSLDEQETIDEREKKARKDGKRKEPVVCPKCSFVFSGRPSCPECGHALARAKKAKEALTQAELLVEVDRGGMEAVSGEEKARRALSAWVRAVHIAAAQGSTIGAASMMFKREHGQWPDRFPGLAEAAAARGYPMPRGQDWRRAALDLFPHLARA